MDSAFKCPACKKDNPLETNEPCLRCKTNLEPLRKILQCAQRELNLGNLALQREDWDSAAGHATEAWKLHHTREIAQLGFIAETACLPHGVPQLWLERVHSFPSSEEYSKST